MLTKFDLIVSEKENTNHDLILRIELLVKKLLDLFTKQNEEISGERKAQDVRGL